MQLGQLRKAFQAFKDVDAMLLAVDPHESWSAKYLLREAGFEQDQVDFPMLMDPSLTVSSTYGVASQMRIHVELSNRPATFVIDKAGVLRYEKRANQFNDRPTAEKIIEVVKGLTQ